MKKNLVVSSLTIYLLFLSAFVFLRFLPAERFCTRALECAGLSPAPEAPFQENFYLKREKICGDLAKMHNRPDLCQWRKEEFITGPWGFRNRPEVSQRQNEVILYGDSFAFGEGNSQEDIPSEALERVLGKKIYNGAGHPDLAHLHWLLEMFKDPPRKIIYLHLERHFKHKDHLDEFYNKYSDNLWTRLLSKLQKIKKFNPVEIWTSRFEKNILIPAIFPNRFEKNMALFELKNNAQMLFLDLSVDRYVDPRTAQLTHDVAFFIGFKKLMDQNGILLRIVLVPEKYTVYAPLLKNPPQTQHNQYLNVLHDELLKRGVRTTNLLPALQKKAKELLVKNEYVYWLDDTHWNPTGIRFSTQVIKDSLIDF